MVTTPASCTVGDVGLKNPKIDLSVTISAPLDRVWEYAMDISHIPEFHPRVDMVEALSGTTQRAEGVEYRCNILTGPSRGRGTCVERIGQVVPMEHFMTTIPEDSWGLSKIFLDYQVETSFEKVDDGHTKMTIRQYYSPRGFKGKLVNAIAHRRLTRQTLDTMNGMKQALEASES
jgi:uncharacterized protein YndB with AHSA1/START domain